jgi:copper chaperone CopZ
MRTGYILVMGLSLLAACGVSTTTDNGKVAARTENIVGITEGKPMATADLGISGMTCEMMCGGMIKSALVKVVGVEKADVAYTAGDAIGHVKVTYDPAQVEDARLVETVQGLANGQYKVESIAVEKQVKEDRHAEVLTAAKSCCARAVMISEVRLPSLLGMLFALVRA